jgi:hypothetical protein
MNLASISKQDHYSSCLRHSRNHHPTPITNEARWIFGQIFARLSHYLIDMSPHNGIEYIVARHRRGEGNKAVQEDKDRGTHDWVSTRQKSMTS